jgi:hypothetical protein
MSPKPVPAQGPTKPAPPELKVTTHTARAIRPDTR